MEDGEAQRDAITARMRGQDYAGARALLLRTLQTNPRLDGALEMLPVLEVLCCAAAGRGGVDWYRVLQVLPGDDAARIEARYKRIVAQVEPAMGAVPGAELALKLVDEAYAVLSDPEKREGFDSRNVFTRFVRSGVVDAPLPGGTVVRSDRVSSLHTKEIMGPEAAKNAALHSNYADMPCFDGRDSRLSNVASSSGTKRMGHCFLGDDSELQSPDGTHVDKKQKGVCEKDVYCMTPSQEDWDACFDDPSPAMEEDLDACFDDPSGVKEDELCSRKQYEYHNFEEDKAIENFAPGQVWAAYDWEKFPRRYALIVEVLVDKMQLYVSWFKPCLQTPEEKKWSHAGLPLVCGTFVAEEHRISLICPTMFCHQIFSDNNLNQDLEVYPQEGEVWAIYCDWDIGWYNDPRMWKNSAFSIVEILTSYSSESGCTVAPLVKVDGNRNVFQRHFKNGTEHLLHIHRDNLIMFSHRIPSFRFTPEAGTMFELEHSAVPENIHQENTSALVSHFSELSGLHDDTNGFPESVVAQFSNPKSTSKMEASSPMQAIMSYNTKWFHKDFLEGQIWAVFDSRDRMPRSYVRIIQVVSCTSVFVLKLEPHPMLNEEIQWVEDGLPVASGVFRAGTETTYKDIWEFSHPVECDWSAKRSFYRIFPQKGEIWAMLKNWKINLNCTDIDKCEPRMVEILSDYSDENGVNVCSLARVKNCFTFFHRVVMEDFHLTRWIPRSEMLSFSHRVPAFVIVDIKDHDIPNGSWHLEPSALPTKIIH